MDIFSAGVILFVLKVGEFPFYRSCIKDPNYKFIFKEDYNTYWRSVSKRGTRVFSPEFKEIITGMLIFNPDNRYNISKIESTKFFNGEVATTEEVKYEFMQRLQYISAERELERK